MIKWCVRKEGGRGGHTNSFFDLTISDNNEQASKQASKEEGKREGRKEGRKKEVENR
jgi:hypothetical protein